MIRREDNVKILYDTFDVFNRKSIPLKLSTEEMKKAIVVFPDEIKEPEASETCKTDYRCENTTSFSMAEKLILTRKNNDRNILVLNLASPTHPGGGVRRGSSAQEEDLCRKSSLLFSLESRDASPYYKYNRNENNCACNIRKMASDAVIISPNVEVIKDSNNQVLNDSFVVSVITCAAPNIREGLGDVSESEYQNIMRSRIHAMLCAAAMFGHKDLVLGALGCGVYRNDAKFVAKVFYDVLEQNNYGFANVWFAVLDNTKEQYNFKNFSHYFK